MGGFARIGKHNVMLIGHNKGKNVEENIERNFGQARPEGYRKALRLMKLAEKFGVPVVTLIDTSGAYPGLDAEERGQAEAIARNLTEMAKLEVPIVTVVTGEGGSGGALGIAVGDTVMMLQYAVYSVISPEGCASILWKDQKKVEVAARELKMTAADMADLGVADRVIVEPPGGAHRDPEAAAVSVGDAIADALSELVPLGVAARLDARYNKFRRMGSFLDNKS